jgi:hypothetical protein
MISFDTSPLIYLLFAFASVVSLGGFLLSSFRKPHFPEKSFFLLSAIFLFLTRLPVLVFNRELNADESQILAQALTLTFSPVYWNSVDGTTGGPLLSYFLVPIGLIFGRFDYITAHTGAFILVLFTIFFLFKALKNWVGAVRAAIGIFPLILFYGFTKSPDFVHYSSEHLPVALLALCLWLASSPNLTRRSTIRNAVWLGIILALIPLGKIQAIPLAGVLALFALWRFLKDKAWHPLLYCLSSGIGAYVVIFAIHYFHEVLDDFWTFYIQGNFRYKNDSSFWENAALRLNQFLTTSDLFILFMPVFLYPALILSSRQKHKLPDSIPLFILGITLWMATVFAVSRTGSDYLHYFLFMTIPMPLIVTCIIPPDIGSFARTRFGFIVTPLVLAVFVSFFQYHQTKVLNPFPSNSLENRRIPFTETAKEASHYLSKGDYLVVWGWNCQYYVECAAPQGVAENHSIRSIYDHTMLNTYQERYIKNIIKNKPAVFIDATGKNSLWLQDTLTQSYKSFPALASYVDRNYRLIARPDGNRLFVRNDLL